MPNKRVELYCQSDNTTHNKLSYEIKINMIPNKQTTLLWNK